MNLPDAGRLPAYFISHGGGPWPWMKDQLNGAYDQLEAALADMPRQIGRKPRAILMVSAHWEAPAFTVQAHPHPPMIYDYGGFPEHTYRVQYPAAGDPALAAQVHDLIELASLPAALDIERGFDHGMFSPMAAIYPQADVPVVQLSLKRGLDAAEHLALGRAIAPLRDDDVLIVGSGLSYHNLRQFGPAARDASKAFDDWLHDTVRADGTTRDARLIDWANAPAARQAHPREEHLIPLMVAAGTASDTDEVERVYQQADFMGGVAVSSFRFGNAAGG